MFTCVVAKAGGGGTAVEFTPQQQSMQFTTVAVGGFGQCAFTVIGDRRRDFPPMSTLRVFYGTSLAWEGRVEDIEYAPADSPVTTQVTCYGFQRLLTDVSVRRIWSKRDINWVEDTSIIGVTDGTNTLVRQPSQYSLMTGQFDPSNLANNGVRIRGIDNGGTVVAGDCNGAILQPASGLTFTRLMVDIVNGNGGHEAVIEESPDGTSWANALVDTTTVGLASYNIALNAGTKLLRLIGAAASTFGISSAYHVDFQNIRLLGTAIQEDSAGGFYGGTILRDLLSLIPSMGLRQIDNGTDFLIPSIERSVRDTIASVVAEIAGYYTREWAVWEGPAFQWQTVNLDEAQWLVENEQLLEGTRIQGSVDQLFRTVYVLYTNAVSPTGQSVTSEQSAAAADGRNPLAALAATKDQLVQAPAVMTDNTAAQLAALNAASQTYPPVNGTIVLNATTLIKNAVGEALPAALIRAGQNIYLPGMPKFDSVFTTPARDGQTLFHVTQTAVDMEAGTQTLQVDGQANDIDVLNARLAAVTRVITG